jgi:hemerythrin superfamily protein
MTAASHKDVKKNSDWPSPTATLPLAGVSLAKQDFRQLGGRLSVLSRQKADHVELNRLLERLAETAPDGQDAVLRHIYRLVFPHAFAEEAVLWPAIRRVLPDGNALTLRIEQEHQQINALVTRLEKLKPGSTTHRETLNDVVRLLREDVRDEEDALLPRLQERVSVAQLRLLGFEWEAVRRIAPTRPHPVVSRRPPGNTLSALPLSVLDRSRDTIEALTQRGIKPVRPRTAISAGLTRAAHATEYAPGLRSGEDPSTRSGKEPDLRLRGAALAIAAVLATSVVAYRRRAPGRERV